MSGAGPTIRAVVRTRGGVTIERRPPPAPGPGEALIRPTLLGVAPADARAARGETPFEGVLGHRFVGVVEAVGGGGEGPAARPGVGMGARVVGEINIVPPDAPLAKRGLGQHAPERGVLGLAGRDGCFADRFALPLRNAVPVPEGVPDEAAVFAEPLAAAVHAGRVVRLESKAFVTVVGDNVPALLCAQVMARLNATVRLVAERDDRFGLCDRWGVRHRPIGEIGLRQDQDVVIECTGRAEMVALAFGLVRPRGSVVLKAEPLPLPGLAGRGPGPDLAPAVLNELELIGARCGTMRDGLTALEPGGSTDPIDTAGLIGRRAPLDDAPAVLAAADTAEALTPVLVP